MINQYSLKLDNIQYSIRHFKKYAAKENNQTNYYC